MESSKLLQYTPNPINFTFDGSNYKLWAREMCSFTKGRLLWSIVTGEIFNPFKKKNEDNDVFIE